MNKQNKQGQTQTTVWWLPEGKRSGDKEGQGGQLYGGGKRLHCVVNIQGNMHVVCYRIVHLKHILSANVTPIPSIEKGKRAKDR